MPPRNYGFTPPPPNPTDPFGIRETARETRFPHGPRCPHCDADRIIRWGHFPPRRQRYRCRDCRRTFSDLTGTIFAYSKRLHRWPAYIDQLRRGRTLRHAAAKLDLHLSTSFRWRHRYLDELVARERIAFPAGSVVELDSVWFAYSEKGSRPPPPDDYSYDDSAAYSRRRGLRGRGAEWITAPKVEVALAVSRARHIAARIVDRPSDVDRLLRPVLSPACTVISQHAPQSTLVRWLLRDGHAHRRVRGSATANREQTATRGTGRHPFHHVRSYRTRLLVWMERFRGVATRYLDNYLAWHRLVDPDEWEIWIRAAIATICPAPVRPPEQASRAPP